MAKNSYQLSLSVRNWTKVGKPRRSKKGKGNAPSRTSRSGNGKRIR